ncbi:MAG: hypothetical protein ACLUD2_10145 [Clostridium sp.]
MRVLGIVLFPGAVISVQTAYVSRNMEFRGLFFHPGCFCHFRRHPVFSWRTGGSACGLWYGSRSATTSV